MSCLLLCCCCLEILSHFWTRAPHISSLLSSTHMKQVLWVWQELARPSVQRSLRQANLKDRGRSPQALPFCSPLTKFCSEPESNLAFLPQVSIQGYQEHPTEHS